MTRVRGGGRRTLAALALVAVLAAAVLMRPLYPPGDRPGQFSYYVLALSWSPTYCASEGRERDEPQCAADAQYGFVLHGLWPQHDEGWPEFCETGDRAWVPEPVIQDMLDIMPSRGLAIHQYRKHGTCSGLDPEAYFAAARRAYASVHVPLPYASPVRAVRAAPDDIERDFVADNPEIDPGMVAVACGPHRRLREVRICFSRDLEPRPCGPNEDRQRLCALDRVIVPPVRQ